MSTKLVPSRDSAEVAAWCGVLLLPVAFVLHQGAAVVWILAALVVVCGVSIRQPVRAVALISATALLGPIATINLPGGLIVHLGDIYLGALTLTLLAREGLKFPLRFGRDGPLLTVLMCGVMVSWLFSLDMFASLPTIVGIVELMLVYVLTQYAVHDIEDASYLVNAWIAAVTLSSLLVVVSYLRADVLILGATPEVQASARSIRISETLLFRASFFVTGFIFPLAAVVAVSAAKLMFEDSPTPSRRLLLGAVIANCCAVVAMGNATAALGALLGISTLALFLPWMRLARGRFALGVLGISLAGTVLALIVRQVVPAAQLALLLARRSDTVSLEARLFVWRNVFGYLADTPHALFLGLGPDISIRLASDPLLRNLFRGGGLQQAAVDNGYLYLALDYGIIVLIAVLLVGGRSLYSSFSAATRGTTFGVFLWTIIVVWGIMNLTQQHGVAKPVFMIVQIVALTHIVRRRHKSFPSGSR